MLNLTQAEIKEHIRDYIQENLILEDVTLAFDTDLVLGQLIDSLDVIHLITFVQTEFDVVIPPVDVTIENFRSINTISEYLQKRS